MNTYRLAPLACLLTLGSVVASTSAMAQPRTPRAEIVAVHDSMTTVFNRGNPGAVARFYADDARIDGERAASIRGRAAIDQYVEYLVLWRREASGALRIAVDYYRH